MAIKTATEGYVTLEIPDSLFSMVRVLAVPTGKTRTEGGRVEAEFICISKESPEPKVWATREQIV